MDSAEKRTAGFSCRQRLSYPMRVRLNEWLGRIAQAQTRNTSVLR